MNTLDKSLLVFSLLLTATTASLALLAEKRPEVYAAMAILVYFVYTSIDNSIRIRAKLYLLDLSFLLIFSLIIGYRIAIIAGIL
mgnify:CR=1 FL=1